MKNLAPNDSVPATNTGGPLIAGLAAAGCTVLLLSLVFGESPGEFPVFLVALVYISLAFAANALGVYAAGVMLDRDVRGVAWRSGATAAWLAPLAVHLQSGSLWAVPIAVAVATRAVVLFQFFQGRFDKSDDPLTEAPNPGEIFHLLKPRPLSRLLWLVGAVFCLEGTFAAGAAEGWLIAAAFAATAAAILGWHIAGRSAVTPVSNAPRGLTSSGLTLILALWLTTGGLGIGLGNGSSDEGSESLDTSESTAGGSGGQYRGIILWAPPKPEPKQLISPDPSTYNPTGKTIRTPVRIPFDGAYWFFKPPHRKPPPGATVLHGTPDAVGFRSTDSLPLIMEAHQKLANPFDLMCCSKIDVVVRNAEERPGTVTIELLLIDSSAPIGAGISLGGAAVKSRRREITETLSFPMPPYPSIARFDEVALRFHLSDSRKTLGPKMRIEYFVMIPPGDSSISSR